MGGYQKYKQEDTLVKLQSGLDLLSHCFGSILCDMNIADESGVVDTSSTTGQLQIYRSSTSNMLCSSPA